MANSDELRKNLNQHIQKNSESKHMDNNLENIITNKIMPYLKEKYPKIEFKHQKKMSLEEVIDILKDQAPSLSSFFCKKSKTRKKYSEFSETAFFMPDGGILYFEKDGKKKIILISEMKRQGTNDKRINQKLGKQSKGNAVERLGKNLIIVRDLFKSEKIIPFVCFGKGCDFSLESSILDRIISMNDGFSLNKIIVKKDYLPFEPVSMMFKEKDWTEKSITNICLNIAETSISYYLKQ